MKSVKFEEMSIPRPTYEEIAAEYEKIQAAFSDGGSPEQRAEGIERWDALRRQVGTWMSLTNLRFNQDTRNPDYKKERDYADEIRPKLMDLGVNLKKVLVNSPHRGEMEAKFGRQAFDLWDASLATYDPAIEEDMVRESKLEAEYTELLASAEMEFRGETYNLPGISKFREHADRDTRYEMETVRWGWFEENAEALDRIYDDMVKVRTGMARKLGFDNFIPLAYKRMSRVDYDQADVEQYRAAVREHVVPLCEELRRRQADVLGIDKVMFWDESVQDPRGNPAPMGDHDWMLERAQEMFDGLDPRMADFFRLMNDSNLLDLKTREGKAGGGFCTNLTAYGLPFIFANFNGTKGDVEVFTHEMGHAFQDYMSRQQILYDYLSPTIEACEIHSMGLEYLTWPHMEKFFGEDAQRFRNVHLAQSLLFLPYGVAVDHFQHLVYASPEATPAERLGMWQEMEKLYMPWRDYGDVGRPSRGGLWQAQGHIYQAPFYYIDYTLASVCAMQIWVQSEQDHDKAMEAYVALCSRGGEAPFQELAKGAGLKSPFEEDALPEVVAHARKALEG